MTQVLAPWHGRAFALKAAARRRYGPIDMGQAKRVVALRAWKHGVIVIEADERRVKVQPKWFLHLLTEFLETPRATRFKMQILYFFIGEIEPGYRRRPGRAAPKVRDGPVYVTRKMVTMLQRKATTT